MTREEAITEVKSLINDVIDYNEKHGTHIFIAYSPHVELVSFFFYNSDKKWNGHTNQHHWIEVNYDFNLQSMDGFADSIDEVRSLIEYIDL